MPKIIFKFIIALVGGLILGNLLAMPIGAIIDLMYGHTVTGSNVPINFPNIIYIISMGFLSGFVAGVIYKQKGMLLGGTLIILQLIGTIGIFILAEQAVKDINYSVLWYCIELLPCVFGGYIGEKIRREKIMSLRNIVGGGFMGIGVIAISVLGLIIHIWTIIIAYSFSGIFASILTLIFPILSEIYWFFKVGNNFGYSTLYCVANIAYVCFLGIAYLGTMILSKDK
jgi:hypothetical protein